MAGTWARVGVRERIEAIGAASLDARSMRRQVLAVLREVVDFDAYIWLLTDPVTAVGVAPLVEVPFRQSEIPGLIRARYATPLNRWTILQSQVSHVALLNEAVGGDLARTRAWREVLSRYGICDVMSVVFADQFGCWGYMDLGRGQVRQPFSGADAGFITSLVAPLTTALRRCQARTFIQPAAPHRHDAGPVVLTLDDDLRIASSTAASRAWLEVLLAPGSGERTVPIAVYNVAAQLLAVEDGVDDHPASTRTHMADGFRLTVRAARLSADEPQPGVPARASPALVVTVEESSAAERLDLFGRAFGLTTRECELLGLLATGRDTRAMARHMSVSEHTVQDHLKSIFTKTGSRDRVGLLSRALGIRDDAIRCG